MQHHPLHQRLYVLPLDLAEIAHMTWQLLAHLDPACIQTLTSERLLWPLHEHIKAFGSLHNGGCMLNAYSHLSMSRLTEAVQETLPFESPRAWSSVTLLLLSIMWRFVLANLGAWPRSMHPLTSLRQDLAGEDERDCGDRVCRGSRQVCDIELCPGITVAGGRCDVDAWKSPVSLGIPHEAACLIKQGCILQLCLLASIAIHEPACERPVSRPIRKVCNGNPSCKLYMPLHC